MKSTFDLGLMKLIAVLVVTVCMVSCLSVISEEISDLFDQDDRSFSFSFEEDMSDKYFLINSLLVNTDLQTVTVNEKEIKLFIQRNHMLCMLDGVLEKYKNTH